MIHGLFILLTHTRPINHNDMFFKVIYGEDLPRTAVQAKNAVLNGALFHQIHFQGKGVLS